MHVDDRVIVDIGDPHIGCDLLGHLVHIPSGRDSGADVDDLPHPGLADQEPHGPLQERAVLPRDAPHFRHGAQHLRRGLAVDEIVVLAAQIVVVHARRMRPGRVDL